MQNVLRRVYTKGAAQKHTASRSRHEPWGAFSAASWLHCGVVARKSRRTPREAVGVSSGATGRHSNDTPEKRELAKNRFHNKKQSYMPSNNGFPSGSCISYENSITLQYHNCIFTPVNNVHTERPMGAQLHILLASPMTSSVLRQVCFFIVNRNSDVLL